MPTYRRKSFLYLSIVVDFLSLLRSFDNRTVAVCRRYVLRTCTCLLSVVPNGTNFELKTEN